MSASPAPNARPNGNRSANGSARTAGSPAATVCAWTSSTSDWELLPRKAALTVGDHGLAEADTAVARGHPRVREHPEPPVRQGIHGALQQEDVLEHPAGERDGADACQVAQASA